MSLLEVTIASIIQGLTEFLPVSSSGHLLILNYIFGVPELDLTFFIYLHFITLLVTCIFFFDRIRYLKRNEIFKILLASVPIIVVGAVVESFIHNLSAYQLVVSFFLVITSGVNFLVHKLQIRKKYNNDPEKKEISISNIEALKIGLAQVLALFPGVSRSAMTIWAGMKVGLNQKRAFDFAFLLSIPVIAGANFYEALKLLYNNEKTLNLNPGIGSYLLAAIVTGFFSYVSLKLLENIMKKAKFQYFAFYCLILAVLNLGIVLY